MITKILTLFSLVISFLKSIIPFIKFTEPLKSFCDDIKHVYIFKEHCVIPDYDLLYKSLIKQIKKERKSGEVLVLDLSSIKQYNDNTHEALREAIREMILKNNIRAFIVFPKTKLKDLYAEIESLINDKSSHSVIIKKDERKKRIIKKALL